MRRTLLPYANITAGLSHDTDGSLLMVIGVVPGDLTTGTELPEFEVGDVLRWDGEGAPVLFTTGIVDIAAMPAGS